MLMYCLHVGLAGCVHHMQWSAQHHVKLHKHCCYMWHNLRQNLRSTDHCHTTTRQKWCSSVHLQGRHTACLLTLFSVSSCRRGRKPGCRISPLYPLHFSAKSVCRNASYLPCGSTASQLQSVCVAQPHGNCVKVQFYMIKCCHGTQGIPAFMTGLQGCPSDVSTKGVSEGSPAIGASTEGLE